MVDYQVIAKKVEEEEWTSLFWTSECFKNKKKSMLCLWFWKQAIKTENSTLAKEVQELKAKQSDQVIHIV